VAEDQSSFEGLDRLPPAPRREKTDKRPSSIATGFGFGIGFILAGLLAGGLLVVIGCAGCLFMYTGGFSHEGIEQVEWENRLLMVNDEIDKQNHAHPDRPPTPHWTMEELKRKWTEPETKRRR
jgi:hypothetical protein